MLNEYLIEYSRVYNKGTHRESVRQSSRRVNAESQEKAIKMVENLPETKHVTRVWTSTYRANVRTVLSE